jgi:hypothetical protein
MQGDFASSVRDMFDHTIYILLSFVSLVRNICCNSSSHLSHLSFLRHLFGRFGGVPTVLTLFGFVPV